MTTYKAMREKLDKLGLLEQVMEASTDVKKAEAGNDDGGET
jgi:hypothetical protein